MSFVKQSRMNSSSALSESNDNNNNRNQNRSTDNNQKKPHNFGNDYNDHFLYTGVFPQNHVTNIQDPLIGYPKLQRLHDIKAEQTLKYAHPPFAKNIQRQEINEYLGSLPNIFDVVMVGGCLDNDPPTLEQLMNLKIGKISPRPSIVFLWLDYKMVNNAKQILDHWGFRRSEDIVLFNLSPNSLHFPSSQFLEPNKGLTIKTTWHCVMGLKGTVRRSDDADLINCNVDTDVLFDGALTGDENGSLEKNPFRYPLPTESAEEDLLKDDLPGVVPNKIYRIIENFCLMDRRIHIIPSRTTIDKPVRLRPGWVVLSPDVYLDNFSITKYVEEQRKNGTSGNRVPLTEEIDQLRPKTPPPGSNVGNTNNNNHRSSHNNNSNNNHSHRRSKR